MIRPLAVMFLSLGILHADDAAINQKLEKEAERIPGRRAFLVTELTDKGPVERWGHHANERFAIGSGFKLFILGSLIDDVNAGKKQASDVTTLKQDLLGPPSSEMADWPLGSPVTLHTLALKMISISDNTATDHLLAYLGRTQVEAQMKAMGHSEPSINRPMLFTREMVMLRDRKKPERASIYAKLDEAGKRRYLESEVAKLHDFDALDFDTTALDVSEWFATPMDMARALDWIRRNTTPGNKGESLLRILTVDTKLKFDPKVWTYVGFKGGSEDQLLAGNWLLQHKNGKWYTFHAYFNSPAQKLSIADVASVTQNMFNTFSGELK